MVGNAPLLAKAAFPKPLYPTAEPAAYATWLQCY